MQYYCYMTYYAVTNQCLSVCLSVCLSLCLLHCYQRYCKIVFFVCSLVCNFRILGEVAKYNGSQIFEISLNFCVYYYSDLTHVVTVCLSMSCCLICWQQIFYKVVADRCMFMFGVYLWMKCLQQLMRVRLQVGYCSDSLSKTSMLSLI